MTDCPNWPRCHCPEQGQINLAELNSAPRHGSSTRDFYTRYPWVLAFRLKEKTLIKLAAELGLSYPRVYQIIVATENEMKRNCK